MKLLLKFPLMQLVLVVELFVTIFTLEGNLTLTKWNTILMLENLLHKMFP